MIEEGVNTNSATSGNRDGGDAATSRARLDDRAEGQLVSRAQAGDQGARERLLVDFTQLVRWLATRHVRPNLPLEDLVQEGTIGLLRAIDKFDPSRGTRLVTFARPWIEGEMMRAVRESFLIRLPAEKALALTRLRRAEEQLGEEPSIEALAEALKISPEEVFELSSITRALLTDEDLKIRADVEEPEPLDMDDGGSYSRDEVESLLAAYAEHRGRLEGAKAPERPATPSRRSGRPSEPLHARLLDLDDALDRLPDDLFEAVELRAFYGLGTAEAARWLDVHENTVRNRYDGGVRAIVNHLNGDRLLPERLRATSWPDELTPVESLRLVVRKYESFLEEVAAMIASGDEFWEGMEIGWVLHDEDGWVPLFSRDIRRTAQSMGLDVRSLSEVIDRHGKSLG